jgi:hypothetical protein
VHVISVDWWWEVGEVCSLIENDVGYNGLYNGEQAEVRDIEATIFASEEAKMKKRERLEEIERQYPMFMKDLWVRV